MLRYSSSAAAGTYDLHRQNNGDKLRSNDKATNLTETKLHSNLNRAGDLLEVLTSTAKNLTFLF